MAIKTRTITKTKTKNKTTMKKSFITFMLLLTAICSWAQESKASGEKTIAPIIVEGTLERVPDGTVIMVGDVREELWVL